MKTHYRTAAVALIAFLGAAAIASAAEPAPSINFSSSVTNADGTLSTNLTWSTSPAATSCEASGHPVWTGAKEPVGVAELPPITTSGTYTLTLACTWKADASARLTWEAPTQYTDGTPIPPEALGPYRVFQGTAPDSLQGVEEVAGLSTVREGLAPGTHYFAVAAVTTTGVQSELSAVGSKVIAEGASRTQSVTITVNPKPSAPTQLTVK